MKNKIPKTELQLKDHDYIDQMDSKSAIHLMINSHISSNIAIEKSVNSILFASNKIFEHLSKSKFGRLIYCGAGTSARIGVQDGAELNPTFGWPLNRLDFIIAGGLEALTASIESAEDNEVDAKNQIYKKKVSADDVLISLAASGNTPFSCKVIDEANKRDALTVAISNNPNGLILSKAKIKIILDTGPEVIAGSTRLKAGTAQKICLNILSTMVMIMFGRVEKGQMSHLIANNKKLVKRKLRIQKLLKT